MRTRIGGSGQTFGNEGVRSADHDLFHPTLSWGDVKPEQPKELEQHQHQFRRPSRPMNIPINTAPAIVPRGLRRAMPSSSVATVFACSLAADVISAPLSA